MKVAFKDESFAFQFVRNLGFVFNWLDETLKLHDDRSS
jgi:hypothetical protein